MKKKEGKGKKINALSIFTLTAFNPGVKLILINSMVMSLV